MIEPMACEGLRTIGLSYKDYVPAGEKKADNEVSISWELLESRMKYK